MLSTQPVTKAISLQSNQFCKQEPYEENERHLQDLNTVQEILTE